MGETDLDLLYPSVEFLIFKPLKKFELCRYPSVQAIYLDDQMSGWLIEGNTVIDAQMGIMVGGGRDVVVKGNRFIGCDKALHMIFRLFHQCVFCFVVLLQ